MSMKGIIRYIALLLGAMLLAEHRVAAQTDNTPATAQRFMWDRANTRMATAAKPADFSEAVGLYQELIREGVCNAPLFYNHGIALLEAGHPTEAFREFLRAERYSGSSPAIRQNILLATERAAQNEPQDRAQATLPWYRILVFWHYGLGLSTRIVIALAAFSLICASFVLQLCHWRDLGLFARVVGILVLSLFGSSVVASLHAESRDRTRARTLYAAGPTASPPKPPEPQHAHPTP